MKRKLCFHQILYLILVAVFTSACDVFFQGGNNGTAALLAKAAVYFALYCGFFYIAERLLLLLQQQTEGCSLYRFFTYSKAGILRLSLLFFAVYFFYLLVFYPGVTTGDTLYQIEDLVTGLAPMAYPSTYSDRTLSALMIDSNPVATTLIFSLFYKIGLLLGDPNIGLFLYNLFQIAALAVLFAVVVCYMDCLHVPKSISLISTAFFASPVIASFAITMGKDLLFSFFFVLYFHVFVWLTLHPSVRGGSVKQWLLLTLFSVLIALTNKKGMVLAAFSNLCLLFTVSGRKKLLSIPAALMPYLIVGFVMPQVLFPLFNIAPGGRQEVLGVAFQQTALSLMEHPEKYSEAEKDLFFSLLDLSQEDLEDVYSPTLTDPIKNRFSYSKDPSEVRAYLKMWASHFPQEAGTYIRATLSISGGYFSPHKLFNVYQYTPYSEVLRAFSQPGQTKIIRSNLGALIYWLEQIPVFSVFSQDSFYVFWFPAFALHHFYRNRQTKKLVLLAPFAANILFLVFAPTCITRYGLCQLFTFPMLLAITAQPAEDMPA